MYNADVDRCKGIDVDEDAIKIAKKKKTGVKFQIADLFNLETETKFDLICFFFCLHDLTWPTKALSKAKGLVKTLNFISRKTKVIYKLYYII